MRILQLGKFYPIQGGVEKVMYDLTVSLSRQNIPCDMLCTTAGKHPAGVVILNKYGRVLCVSTWWKVLATTLAPAMITKLRKIQSHYDVIHVHHPDPMATLALFLSGYKGKVVLHWHSDIIRQQLLLRLYAPLQRWLIRRADVIVGTTPTYVKASPFLQNVQSKVISIPIGVSNLAPNHLLATQLRKTYSDKKIVFSLGRLVPYKGYSYLIEAARYLTNDYIILIGGTGPLQSELEELITRWDLGDRVKLLGFIPDEDIAGYYEACDVFCLSSIWKTEAFAIVQIEAMQFGKPIINTSIEDSGVNWVSKEKVSGLQVEPENSVKLATVIRNVLTDEQLYKTLSVGAKERFQRLFMLEKTVRKVVSLYEQLLEQKVERAKYHERRKRQTEMRIREGVVIRHVGSEYLIVIPEQGVVDLTRVYTLNETSVWIWEQLKTNDYTEKQIVEQMQERYDVSAEQAYVDVHTLIEELRKEGLFAEN